MNTTVRATTVHHLAIDIDRPVEGLWDYVVVNMAEGGMFAFPGCDVEQIVDDPAACLGGYRFTMRIGDTVDARICHVTERDEAARRLSLATDALTPAGRGMIGYASYHVIPKDSGSRLQVDSHSSIDLDVGESASAAEIRTAVATLQAQYDEGLHASLAGIKAQLESC